MIRACFSRDGTLIATGGDASVRLWDVGKSQKLADLKGHRGGVFGLACSPDGKTLATADTEGIIRLWDLAALRELTAIAGHSAPVYALAFSPDGTLLASGSADQTVKIWDVATAQQLTCYRGHSGRVTALDFSPDGHTLVSGSVDGTVRSWPLASNPDVRAFTGHKALAGICVAFSADGRLFAVTTNAPVANAATGQANFFNPTAQRIAILDAAKGTLLATLPGNPFIFSTKAGWLASLTASNQFSLWDVQSFQLAGTFDTTNLLDPTSSFAFSPDGKLFAAACRPNAVQFWDVATRQSHHLLPVGTNAVAPRFAFLPDGKELITWAAGDGLVTLWDSVGRRRIRTTAGADRLMANITATSVPYRLTASVSPDGHILANCAADRIFLWELPSLRPLAPATLQGNSGVVTALAFSPDGKTLASASYEGTVKFWNVATWKEVATVRAHISIVFALAFSPEPASRYLATGSFDDTIRLWAAPSFAETDAVAAPLHSQNQPP